MKKLTAVCALVLALTMALAPAAHAAEWADPTQVCYPSSVTQSEDGTEIRKFYRLRGGVGRARPGLLPQLRHPE